MSRPGRRVLAAVTVAVAGCGAAGLFGFVGQSAASVAPFKVMVLTGINTTQNNEPELVAGVQAGAAAVNKAGGLKGGAQLDIIPCSTQSTESVAVQCAQQAVSEGVNDMLQFSAYDVNTLPITEAAGIPNIASPQVSAIGYFDKNWFPVIAPPIAQGVAAVEAAFKADPKNKTWAGVVSESPNATPLINVIHTMVTRLGGTWKGTVSDAATNTNETAQAEAIHQLGATDVFLDESPAPADAFVADAETLGVLPTHIISVGNVLGLPDVQAFPAGQKVFIGGNLPPYGVNLPGLTKFKQQMTAAGLLTPVNEEQDGIQGWLDMWALKDLSERVKGAVTSASLDAEAKKITTPKQAINLFGLISWVPGAKGPAAYPNVPNAQAYEEVATTGPGGKLSLVQKKPIDAWKALGIGH